MITSCATEVVTIQRQTGFVLNGSVVQPTRNPSGQPPRASVVEVEIFHVDGLDPATGVVTIVGSLSGSSVSESLTMDIDSFAQSVQRFDQIDRFEFSAAFLAVSPRPHARARVIGSGGAPQPIWSEVVSGWPAIIEDAAQRWSGAVEGMDARSDHVALIDFAETWTPKIGDVLVSEAGVEYLVRGVRLARSPARPIHWTLNLSERGDSV